MGRRSSQLLVVLATLSSVAAPAKAALIAATNFGFNANGQIVGFAPFDPALGTLDSVNVSISGTFDVLTSPSSNIGPANLPIPYPFTLAAHQSLSATAIGHGFTTVSKPSFVLNRLADGTGATQAVTAFFSYSVDFTAASDLIGFAVTNAGGGLVVGQRSDFLGPPGTLIDELVMEDAQVLSSNLPVTILGASAAGAGIILYDYTPAVTGVPEPASVGLLASGLGAFLLRRHYKKRDARAHLT